MELLELSRYQHLADEAFRRIEAAFQEVDPDLVECETAGDVLTLTFRGRQRCVINTQRPTRQIWVAANARAWHFSFDATASRWFDEKNPSSELFERLGAIVQESAGVSVTI